MSTVDRLEILKEYLDKEEIDYEIYYSEGQYKEEGKNLFEAKETVINELLKRISNLEYEVEERDRRTDKAIEFVESMGYAGYEDYFYDLTTEDINGNDNCFVDSQKKLLSILRGEDK